MSSNKEIKSCLVAKKVKLSLIDKPTTGLFKSKGDSTLLIGASLSIKTPIDEHGILIDPLTDEEREYLESVLKKDLSIYSEEGRKNWNSKLLSIRITRKSFDLNNSTIEFDLSKPIDYIKYKIAIISPKVANTWGEKGDSAEYLLVIKDGEVEFTEKIKKVEKEDKVLEYLFKNKSSKKKLFNLIRLYGDTNKSMPITYNSSLELMYTTLREAANTTDGINGLYPLIMVDEKELANKILLADAVTIDLIEKRGWEYRLVGGEKIGNNAEEAILYLMDKKNQATKIRIEQGIEEFYNKYK